MRRYRAAICLIAWTAMGSTAASAAASVTAYFPQGAYDGLPFNRQGQMSADGNFVYYFSFYGSGPGGSAILHVNKASITSTTVTSGTDMTIPDVGGGSFGGPDSAFAPVGGYVSGTKLWVQGNDTATNTIPSMFSFDKTSLAEVDEVSVGADESDFAGSRAITADGGIFAGGNGTGDGIFLFNTSTHQHGSYTFAAKGGPGDDNFNGLQFDNAGNLWAYDDTSHFWVWPVTLVSGVPTLGTGTSVVGRTNDGSDTGPLDYNPVTNIITAWSPGGVGAYVIPINATTHTVGTIFNLARTPAADDGIDINMAQAHSWGTSDYVGINNRGGAPNFNAIVPGIYQRSTGTATFYTWASFGGTEPTDITFSLMTASPDAQEILGVSGGDAGLTNQNWLFQFGSSPPGGSRLFMKLTGVGQ